MTQPLCIWDIWIADVGATGISFARGRMDAGETILVHAPPEKMDVELRTTEGTLLAQGKSLQRTADTPIARLHKQGDAITREDIWPTEVDYGMPVIVAGGEIGILQRWWNDRQHQQWRWSLEFYNHR